MDEDQIKALLRAQLRLVVDRWWEYGDGVSRRQVTQLRLMLGDEVLQEVSLDYPPQAAPAA